MARPVLLVALALALAGCSDSLPGGKVTTPTPLTVIGAVTTPWSGGDAVDGLAVFRSAGCVACHTFAPAHSTGTVGPNLDTLAADDVSQKGGPLDEFIYNSIVDPAGHSVPGYKAGIMPSTFGQTLSHAQLADLVAFLAKGP